MTYDILASSRAKARPVETYLFVVGNSLTDFFAYTDGDNPISYDASDGRGVIEYEPLAIKRGAFSAFIGQDNTSVPIEVPDDCGIAALFDGLPPSAVVSVIVRAGHLGDSGRVVVGTGRILGATFGNSDCVLDCEPTGVSMQRPGLRKNYQLMCSVPLYSQGHGLCNADEEAATTSFTVATVSDNLVALTAWGASDEIKLKHRGGRAYWTAGGRTVSRSIIRVTPGASSILLAGTATGLDPGDTINIVLACNHSTDCVDLHNNGPNYQGYRRIPTKNPYGNRNNFY